MRTGLKRAVYTVTVLVFLFMAALFYVGRRDLVEHEYATYEQAKAAGAFENDALPGLVPKSATNIHSVRNLDSNTEVVSFSYGPDFEIYLASQVSAPAQSASEIGIRRQGPEFADHKNLIYFPKIETDSYRGSVLVNSKVKRALYFE